MWRKIFFLPLRDLRQKLRTSAEKIFTGMWELQYICPDEQNKKIFRECSWTLRRSSFNFPGCQNSIVGVRGINLIIHSFIAYFRIQSERISYLGRKISREMWNLQSTCPEKQKVWNFEVFWALLDIFQFLATSFGYGSQYCFRRVHWNVFRKPFLKNFFSHLYVRTLIENFTAS